MISGHVTLKKCSLAALVFTDSFRTYAFLDKKELVGKIRFISLVHISLFFKTQNLICH